MSLTFLKPDQINNYDHIMNEILNSRDIEHIMDIVKLVDYYDQERPRKDAHLRDIVITLLRDAFATSKIKLADSVKLSENLVGETPKEEEEVFEFVYNNWDKVEDELGLAYLVFIEGSPPRS